MAASTNPVAVAGTVSFPPDEGQSPVPISFGLNGQYTQIVDQRLVMTGAGSQSVSFGTIGAPGVKVMLIEYEVAAGAAAVNLRVNGGSDDIEITPGGFIAYGSPAPVDGIVSLLLVHTADAVIRVRLFG